MNKAIFLDIDGVLNLFGESYKTNSVAFDTHFQEIITRMDFHLVKRLEYIIDETDADIILISAWDLDSAKRVLKQNEFNYLDKIKSKLYSPDRVEGILEYIKDNNITDYIVLDDEIDIPKALNLAPKEYRNSWVGILIKPEEGLTNKAATYAVKLLNRTLPGLY
nr:MAG TPA: HAD domain protein [Caudoviricetes sp.]